MTLNGQDFLSVPRALFFTFYAVDDSKGVTVTRVSPLGGPSTGGTLIQLTGTGFLDFGGVFCVFRGTGGLRMVPATRTDARSLRCATPAVEGLGDAFSGSSVDVTVNGHAHASTQSSAQFSYYALNAVAVSHAEPRGAVRSISVPVTIWGTGFQDLDRGHVRSTVARARWGVGTTPGTTATQPARGASHPRHHRTRHAPGVRPSRPGVRV